MAVWPQPAALQGAFGIVLFVVVALAVVVAIASLLTRSRIYEQIGRGGLSLNEDRAPSAPPAEPSGRLAPAALEQERDDEIRQMLQARNERRSRRGEAPLDIEAELARLTATTPATTDPLLAEEIRQLVIARNERRARQGKAPLDVEEEVARQLRELGA
jgi:hypothetical protein